MLDGHAGSAVKVSVAISAGRTSVDIGASAKLELVDKFCYLGDAVGWAAGRASGL